MSTRTKWAVVIVAGTIVAMLFGATGPLGGFWGMEEASESVGDPTGGPLAALIGAVIVESIAFGVGLAWLAFGWPLVNRVNRPLALPTFLAIGWGLVSWAPHTSFHQSLAEGNYGGLAAIEWGFHVTLVIAAFVIAAFVWQVLRTELQANASTATAATPA